LANQLKEKNNLKKVKKKIYPCCLIFLKSRGKLSKTAGQNLYPLEECFRIRFLSHIILNALGLFIQGMSYRDVSRHLSKTTGLKISQITIRNWAVKYRENNFRGN